MALFLLNPNYLSSFRQLRLKIQPEVCFRTVCCCSGTLPGLIFTLKMSLYAIFLFPVPCQVIVFYRAQDFSFQSLKDRKGHCVKQFLYQTCFSSLSSWLSLLFAEIRTLRVCDRRRVALSPKIKHSIILSFHPRRNFTVYCKNGHTASEEAGRVISTLTGDLPTSHTREAEGDRERDRVILCMSNTNQICTETLSI